MKSKERRYDIYLDDMLNSIKYLELESKGINDMDTAFEMAKRA